MNDFKLLSDDPKLTAYALGELEGEERAAVEAALDRDPALRAAVEETRAMSAQLEAALAMEATEETKMPVAAPLARVAIIPGRDLSKLDGGPLNELLSPLTTVIRFPQFYYVAAGLAAACFAVLVALRTPPPRQAAPTQKIYTEIDLTAPSPKMALAVAPATAGAQAADAKAVPEAAPADLMSRSQPTPPIIAPRADENLALLDQVKKEAAAKGAGGQTAPVPLFNGALAFGGPNPGALGAGTAGGLAGSAGGRKVGAAAPFPAKDGNAVKLSAFEVSTSKEAGYAATATLSGSRLALNAPAPATAAPTAAAAGMQWSAGFAGAVAGNEAQAPRYISTTVAPEALERMPGFRVLSLQSGNTETYADVADNAFLGAAQNPLSTFAIDVDTAGYSNVRRFLEGGRLPPRDAVRVEELVNYFPYRYPAPVAPHGGETNAKADAPAPPFAASMEVADAPWAPTHRLVRIGLKGREVAIDARPAANLVFLLDVSGSMSAPNKLPLVKESMRLLVGKLRPDDRVAIVTYAGQSGLALPSTLVAQSRDILDALDALAPGGSTNGAMGLQLAYDIAKANLVPGGINRVILCTDGDFNVGVTGEGDLVRLIEEKAKSGVALTALGFGMGNLKDRTLERIADRGNGNYGYIDTRREAEKLLVEQVNGTLMTIAKDVKIQVEFNPAKVASYRLIGYENRMLKQEDFNNDKVDAGEIGAGHTVTAFYEVVPVGAADNPAAAVPAVDELKYQAARAAGGRGQASASSELLTVKLRYKDPAADLSQKLDFPLTDSGGRFENASADFKFASAVAAFGMILRESPHKGSATMGDVIAWAAAGAARTAEDVGGYRGEFIDLARKAQALMR